jgi:hypothetical protein
MASGTRQVIKKQRIDASTSTTATYSTTSVTNVVNATSMTQESSQFTDVTSVTNVVPSQNNVQSDSVDVISPPPSVTESTSLNVSLIPKVSSSEVTSATAASPETTGDWKNFCIWKVCLY